MLDALGQVLDIARKSSVAETAPQRRPHRGRR